MFFKGKIHAVNLFRKEEPPTKVIQKKLFNPPISLTQKHNNKNQFITSVFNNQRDALK